LVIGRSHRVDAEGTIVFRTGLPVREDAASFAVEQSGNEARRFTPDIHPLLEDAGDILSR
jgi:hypothetical protein